MFQFSGTHQGGDSAGGGERSGGPGGGADGGREDVGGGLVDMSQPPGLIQGGGCAGWTQLFESKEI